MNDEYQRLASTCCDNGMLEIVWQDGASSNFHPIWLRDNCRCEICGDPAIGYRNLRLTQLDLDCKPRSIETTSAMLSIVWDDGHRSQYPGSWLRSHAYDEALRAARVFVPRPWDRRFRSNPPGCEYADAVGDDAALLRVLQRVRDHGICFLRNAPAEPGIVEALARRFGFPQESNFGRVQDLRFDPGKRSIANDVKALKPHTDEPYRASPPGLLLFHCIANDQRGAGASLFMDGFELATKLRQHDAEGFAALCRNNQAFRRHFAGDVDLIAEFPVISIDEFGNLCGVRVNDRVAAPLSIPAGQIEVYYRGLRYLLGLAENESLMLRQTLQPGDIAIFDNHRVLHGRSDLTINGQRWLQWVQVERGDFHSSLRIFADRLGIERDANPLLRGAYGSALQT
ncbi:MAG: TauD/TfdA family dioxygenase [Gammaproteobacteria bacterium]|nr:TauD/TfdA family dioxygenase [Gammaproteobacteria bacterium]